MKKLNQLLFVFLLSLISSSAVSQVFWEEILMPDSITVNCFTIDNLGKIYLGCEKKNSIGGVYISNDNGISWEISGLINHSITGLAIDTNNLIIASGGDGIYKNTGLNNWEFICSQRFWRAKEFYNVLYASTQLEFLSSHDNGNTWDTLIETNSGGEIFSDFTLASEDSIFVCATDYLGGGGVYLSTDNGITWDLSGLNYHFLEAIEKDNFGNIYTGTFGHFITGQGGLYRLDKSLGIWDTLFFYPYITSITFNVENTIYLGYRLSGSNHMGGVMHRDYSAETWIYDTIGLNNVGIDLIIVSPDEHLWAMGYNNTHIFRTALPVSITKEQNEKISFIRIFPNPATTNLTITYKNTKLSNPSISITNTEGKSVYNQGFKPDNTGEINIDISNLKDGNYVVVLKEGSRIIETEKILISN